MVQNTSDEIVIQVDARESDQFLERAREFDIEAGEPVVSAGLGGIPLAEFVVEGITAAVEAIASLIQAWVGKRQYMRIVYDGTIFEGYTIKELEPLLEKLREKDDQA